MACRFALVTVASQHVVFSCLGAAGDTTGGMSGLPTVPCWQVDGLLAMEPLVQYACECGLVRIALSLSSNVSRMHPTCMHMQQHAYASLAQQRNETFSDRLLVCKRASVGAHADLGARTSKQSQ